jgi:hypothetical protein
MLMLSAIVRWRILAQLPSFVDPGKRRTAVAAYLEDRRARLRGHPAHRDKRTNRERKDRKSEQEALRPESRNQRHGAHLRRRAARRKRQGARRPVSRVLSTSDRNPGLGGHSSSPGLASGVEQSTRATGRRMPCAAPIRSCSRRGLPCRPRCRARGALLPHPFDLTATNGGGMLSVALSLALPQAGVTRRRSSLEPGLSSRLRERRPAAARPSGAAVSIASCDAHQ